NPETNSPRAYFVEMLKGFEEFQSGKTDVLAGVKAIDDYTLKFELAYKFAPFVGVLAYNTFVVLPQEDVEKWGEEWNFHPVGTGPFKYEFWRQDDKLVLSKNENYWGKDADGNQLPYLDGLEFRIIEDWGVMWEEFKVGNIYQTFVDDPYYLEAIAKYPDTFFEVPQLGTYYYGMNQELEPFVDNKALRQAMNYAVNREALNELVLNGRQTPAKGVLPPGMFGYNPDLKGYEYDPVKAKELLKEAGYPNGIEMTLQYNTHNLHGRVAEAMQAIYAEVGIKINLMNTEWGTHLDTTARGDVPFFRMGWVCDYNDPDNFLYVLLHSENKAEKGNYSRYHNPIVDMLTLRARRETNPDVRKELYQQAEQIIVDDAPWVFIFHYSTHSLVQPYVRNYVLPSFGQYSNKFVDVWLDL
ncbi:MAG: ABC transporter substrate-binding protein, partial [Desulfobacterales bacterium]|nr:ABC transporter substrate-binding protein [Desulfobacterales bacterium]